jgi:hypothetical protein
LNVMNRVFPQAGTTKAGLADRGSLGGSRIPPFARDGRLDGFSGKEGDSISQHQPFFAFRVIQRDILVLMPSRTVGLEPACSPVGKALFSRSGM